MWSRVRLVKPPAAMRTPSSLNWSSPCEDASKARCVTPSPVISSSCLCSAIGSGVVSEPYTVRFGETRPMVPMLAEAWPSRSQIWRVNAATDVLPLVPVTAAIVAGCRG